MQIHSRISNVTEVSNMLQTRQVSGRTPLHLLETKQADKIPNQQIYSSLLAAEPS